jgi:Tfp pilus assembly protein PilO
MDWWKRQFGLHPVDMAVHFVIGGFIAGALADAAHNDVPSLLAVAAMFLAYAWRRQRAIDRLPPASGGMTSGEVRLTELDAQAEELHEMRSRMAELEERLDFAERMLAQQREPAQIAKS